MTVIPFRRTSEQAELPVPAGRWHERVWVSEKPMDEPRSFYEFVAAHQESKLWPVLIPPDRRFTAGRGDWLDDRPRLPPAGGEIAGLDAEAVLEAWWGEPCCDGKCLEPFGAGFPGLARRSTSQRDPLPVAARVGAVVADLEPCRLGLVAADRSADIPALLGWSGTLDTTDDVAAISAVLRSWEDRFGARLVGLGTEDLVLSVAAPPTKIERAMKIAAEHRSFCQRQFNTQPGNLREFAQGLIDREVWRFSWH
ncbi:MAG: hypothetical protein QOI21_2891 [Actinomycetota bacterium]|jgi:hypothetical protein|nr:hypothetical protein [Actinomycetota bacterium]